MVQEPTALLGLGWDVGKKECMLTSLSAVAYWCLFLFTAIDLDASVVCLDGGKNERETVSFRNLSAFSGAIKHSGDNRTGVCAHNKHNHHQYANILL